MDTVTHAALGVVLGEATFRRRIGRSANWLAALAAVSPDFDVFARWLNDDPWSTLVVHRGATHSLLMVPVIALLWTLLFYAFRRRQFWPMYALAFLAVLTHPLLDLVTSYGTLIFWPLTGRRYAFDFLPIIDVIYSPILLLTLVTRWAVRRVGMWRAGRSGGRELPGTFGARAGRLAARVGLAGLLLSTAYAGVGAWVMHHTILLAYRTVPPDHGQVLHVRSGPLMGTVFARRIAVRTREGFYVARYNMITSAGDPSWTWAPSATGRFVELAEGLDRIRLFKWFAMGMARPAVDRTTDETGRELVRVTYHDMRYGHPADSPESIFKAVVVFNAAGEAVYGPVRSRWGGGQRSPEGVLVHFEPQTRHLDYGSGRWARLKDMWREAWRP